MKKLTAGIFTVLMGLVSVNAADAAVASKGYVDKLDREQGALVTTNTENIATNTENIAKNAGHIGSATFDEENLKIVDGASDLTVAIKELDAAVAAASGDLEGLGALASKNTVGTELIDDSAVTSAKIADGAVATLDLADSAVTSAKIADGAVATLDLADSAVTSAKIADGAVATLDLADSAVTEAKIADNAVTANKLSDDLSTTIAGKADKATTLGGYGITDAYTKTDADDKFIDTTEIGGYATDAELTGVSNVANAADTLSKTNQGAITVLNGDENTTGSVKKQVKDASDATKTAYEGADAATLEAAKGYTDEQIEALDLQAISRVPAECGDASNYCVLTTNGTNFVWEVIVREDTTLGEDDDGLYGDYPATESTVTQ